MRRVAGIAAMIAVIVVGSAFAYRAWRQHENALAYAITSPRGIQEASFVGIGG